MMPKSDRPARKGRVNSPHLATKSGLMCYTGALTREPPMLPLPIIAIGIIACVLGIIALLPDFEHFED